MASRADAVAGLDQMNTPESIEMAGWWGSVEGEVIPLNIEMIIERLEGKWQAGRALVAGLDQMNTSESIEMARPVEGRLIPAGL